MDFRWNSTVEKLIYIQFEENNGHHSGDSKESPGVEMTAGMRQEKHTPMHIPVTMEAQANLAAVEAYSGLTDLKFKKYIKIVVMVGLLAFFIRNLDVLFKVIEARFIKCFFS